MPEVVELETAKYEFVADGVALLTMNRPDHANSVVPELARGADLREMKAYLAERLRVDQEPYNARVIFPLTQKITTSRMPVIAAVNGGATAGGLDLSLACDLRIASSRAKFGETYIKIGMMPGNGGTYFLPRLVGSGMAAELALTGEVISAQRALEIGLVNRVVEPEELIPEAIRLASTIADKPWRALEATKQALRSSWHMNLQSVYDSNFWAVAALHYTDDFAEGVDAFLEKRPPQFGKDVARRMYWEED